tara:strand:- start:4698 stop:5039 length:342 start_codon:yes stop_codon:yes gene_type:complete
MAITYFQDTIFTVDTTLTAPGLGTLLKVAENNLFATKDYTLITVVANIDTNVIVRLDGSIDGTNFAPIISNKTITADGPHCHHARMPVKWVRPRFVSESGGTAAEVTFNIAAL